MNPEDGGSTVLWNTGIHPPHYMEQQPRKWLVFTVVKTSNAEQGPLMHKQMEHRKHPTAYLRTCMGNVNLKSSKYSPLTWCILWFWRIIHCRFQYHWYYYQICHYTNFIMSRWNDRQLSTHQNISCFISFL